VLRPVLVSSRDYYDSGPSKGRFLAVRPVVLRFSRVIVGSLALFLAGSPSILQAQYSDAKIGEYLNYALADTNGSVYVGYNSIGYASPVIYTTAAGWTGLPYSTGFDLSYPYYGYANGVSRDGTVVSGYTWGEVSNGVYVQYAVYWVNGTEQIVPAPPDDPHPTLMAANAVSGDGSTLLVEDTTGSNPAKVETYVYRIATKTFTSVGYFGTATQQTYGAAVNYDGSVAAGYSNLDNGDNNGFRWTEKSGLQDLGVPQPGTYYVEPTCMSDDGTVIFGRYTVGGGWVGFRYTTSRGFQDTAVSVSADAQLTGQKRSGLRTSIFLLFGPQPWVVVTLIFC
jgi:probable HAF family extracellular repeat protein